VAKADGRLRSGMTELGLHQEPEVSSCMSATKQAPRVQALPLAFRLSGRRGPNGAGQRGANGIRRSRVGRLTGTQRRPPTSTRLALGPYAGRVLRSSSAISVTTSPAVTCRPREVCRCQNPAHPPHERQPLRKHRRQRQPHPSSNPHCPASGCPPAPTLRAPPWARRRAPAAARNSI
jgi:hypothetical protein